MIDVLDGRDQLTFRLFVLGAFRPGELFALRWRCFDRETLKVEASVFRGKLGLTKTKASAAVVTLPRSLAAELEQWRQYMECPDPDDLIFPSTVNKPINAQSYLQRILQPTATKAGIEGVTFQSLRRTFATHFHGLGTIKDQQSQMRHSTAQMTLDVYTQSVSESLRTAIEAFDRKLRIARGKATSAGQAPEPK
jgi:integrase